MNSFQVHLVSAFLLVAACGSVTPSNRDGSAGTGGSGGGSDAGTGDLAPDVPLTVEKACDKMAAEICDALDACAAPVVQVFYGDKKTCVERQTLGCNLDQSVAGITRSAADISACGDAVKSASCPDLVASRFPEACAVKPGPRVNGMGCGSDWQCDSTYCRRADMACGVCGPRMAEGQACTVPTGCQAGMVCAASMQCATPRELGAACGDNLPCRSDLYCTKAIAGTCAPKVGQEGGACVDSTNACDIIQGVACNIFAAPANRTCEKLGVAKGGDACGIVNGGLTVCVALSPCSGLLGLSGACPNPAGDGAPCGAGTPNNANCLAPAQCVAGICRLPSAPSCN